MILTIQISVILWDYNVGEDCLIQLKNLLNLIKFFELVLLKVLTNLVLLSYRALSYN